MKKFSFLALCALLFSTVAMAQWPTTSSLSPSGPPKLTWEGFWKDIPGEPHFIDLENRMKEEGTYNTKHDATGYIFTPLTTSDQIGAQVNPNQRVTVWINQHDPNTNTVKPVRVTCEIGTLPNSWASYRYASLEQPIVVNVTMSCKVDLAYPSGAPILKRSTPVVNF